VDRDRRSGLTGQLPSFLKNYNRVPGLRGGLAVRTYVAVNIFRHRLLTILAESASNADDANKAPIATLVAFSGEKTCRKSF
jgi:hypothetical protein